MKTKVLVGTAGLVCLGAANAAFAQSSVSIYGIIDTGLSYVNHAKTATGSSSLLKYGDGVGLGSRWGFKGSEDLGGGMKTIFQLENGFDTGTGALGQGSSMFGRLAYIGVSKTDMGEFTAGRQYSLSTSVLGHGFSMGAQTMAGGFAYHINDLDQLTGSRLSNSLRFMSSNFGGFKFGAMYAFSNQAGAFGGAPSTIAGTTTAGSSRASSFAVEYDHGPFAAAAAYTNISFPTQATPTAFSVAVANVTTNGLRDLRTFGMGARYTLGDLTTWGLWTNTRFEPITGAQSTLNALEASGNYFIRPDLAFGLGYTYEHLDGFATGKWHQANMVLDYFFSKRTDVYLAASYQKALGENLINRAEVPVQAQIGSSTGFLGISGNGTSSQVAARVAIVHRF